METTTSTTPTQDATTPTQDEKDDVRVLPPIKMVSLPSYFFTPTCRGKFKKWYITPTSANRYALANTAHYLALAFAAWDYVVNFYVPGCVQEWTEEDILNRAKKNWRSLNAIQNRPKDAKDANPYIASVEEWVWKQIIKHAEILEDALKTKIQVN